MKKIGRFFKGYVRESIAGPFFKLLEATFELLVPLVMASIIDKGIAEGDRPYVIWHGLLMIALGVIGFACTLSAQYFSAKAAVGFSSKLKESVFSHIQTLSFTELDEIGSSTLITRLTSDINQIQSGLNLTLRLFLRSPFIVFGAMIMAFTINVKEALIFAVTIPLLSVVVFGIMLITMPLYKKVQGKLDRVLLLTRENLDGARVLRAFNKEEDELAKFDSEHGELTRLQQFVGRISALMNPITYAIINLATLLLIRNGGNYVFNGEITQGELIALVNYMSQILIELIKLANLIITMTKSMACLNRVMAVLEIEPSMESGDRTFEETGEGNDTAVSFNDVSLRYRSAGAESLEHVSFEARKGETIGIIGGTGSGKTSLVNMIPRFYDATEGTVSVNGEDVRKLDLKELRKRIGIVLQRAVLFKGTIRDNLRWGKEDATEEEMEEALKTAQAYDFVMEKEKGLDTEITQGATNLSGGQRQRLTIARALIRKPEILILDDSASALDFATDARLREAIRNMPSGPTVFIVSQRTSSIAHADRIIVLDDGKVSGIGTHEELLRDNDVYQEIYYSQFPKEDMAYEG
ncbi:MAG: ABC transporter ATP-binding protein [Clostridia bacterium]|nr:ABC transporter ATP-binding protein [Clostridia bacterium]MBQ5956213.1 ABC transporter ATP-binding protein [Clostridia bacterium]